MRWRCTPRCRGSCGKHCVLAAEDPESFNNVLNEMTALAIERKFDLARRKGEVIAQRNCVG